MWPAIRNGSEIITIVLIWVNPNQFLMKVAHVPYYIIPGQEQKTRTILISIKLIQDPPNFPRGQRVKKKALSWLKVHEVCENILQCADSSNQNLITRMIDPNE